MKLRPVLLSGLLFLLACASEARSERETVRPDKPNIIFAMADDLGIGDVSCYNPESKIRTPFMDGLAADGMRFTDAHSGSAVCTPTRYGVVTGRYAWRSTLKSGVTWGTSACIIPESRLTVASFLKSNGYNTACVGKWHLRLPPIEGGIGTVKDGQSLVGAVPKIVPATTGLGTISANASQLRDRTRRQ